ncbi:hypothetical protein I7I48_12256 [Histoplasma ohiense]|nr:hypothetical protein I7I48_12256 [Histoplasma ohiense (nom. inval.)]
MPDALFDAMDSIKLSLLLAFSCPRLRERIPPFFANARHLDQAIQYNATQRNATVTSRFTSVRGVYY